MVEKSILDRTKDHPFSEMRKPTKTITDQDSFRDEIAKNDLVENIVYSHNILGPRFGAKKKVFENVNFAGSKLTELTFTDCHFINCRFVGTKFVEIEFHNCRFYNCYMFKCGFEKVYVHVDAFAKCLNKKEHANIGVHLYQQLMKNFKETDQPLFYREAFYKFKLWERYQQIFDLIKLLKDNNPLNKEAVSKKKESPNSIFFQPFFPSLINKSYKIVINHLYSLCFGYGTRFWNLFITTLCVVGICWLVNYFYWEEMGLSIACNRCEDKSPGIAFYYTIISLSNLGYGDVVPSLHIGRVWSAFQAVVGLLWFAVVASMVFRRIAR